MSPDLGMASPRSTTFLGEATQWEPDPAALGMDLPGGWEPDEEEWKKGKTLPQGTALEGPPPPITAEPGFLAPAEDEEGRLEA